MTRFSAILLLLSLALSGCAIAVAETPPSRMCNFQRYALQVQLPDAAATPLDRPGDAQTVVQAIDRAYGAAPSPGAQIPDDAMLFMSGGSQNGAFGAGVLDEWKRAAGRLPRFRMVTGISTGAILATFAFIDQPERLVRLEQDDGGTARRSVSYAIRDENQLLRPIVRGGVDRLNLRSGVQLVRRGAVADLDPLRQVLRQEIGDVELRLVAGASDDSDGRLLLVGVVDVDSGQAVALDLTHMARQYRDATSAEDGIRYRHCYVDAIIASSSVPLAALPVFIDNRMYVDGGARFGLFSDEIGRSLDRDGKGATDAGSDAAQRLEASRIYAIVNGDLTTRERCGRRDRRLCEDGGTDGRYGAHEDWSLLRLAGRSEDILVNQIYRMSLDRIMMRSDKQGRRPFPAWIRPDVNDFAFTMDDRQLGTGRLTCAEWRAMDRDLMDPIQFYPRYMHCLIGYGRWQYRERLNWHQPPPPADPVAVAAPKP